MILSEDQHQRYLRHIIIPEIGEFGQKKLIDSSVSILGENSSEAEALLLYITASGIGKLSLCFKYNDKLEAIINHLKDLNPHIHIELINSQNAFAKGPSSCRIVFGKRDFVKETISRIPSTVINSNPLIFAVYDTWQGIIGLADSVGHFDEKMNQSLSFGSSDVSRPGEVVASCVLGALCSIEAIKCILDIGNLLRKPLYIDLLNMRFSNSGICRDNVSNNNIDLEPIKKLKDARVLIIGAGGLGSSSSYALVKSGIGVLGILDRDVIEISNLNRQVLHSTSRIGMPKVQSAEISLKRFNPEVNIVTYQKVFSKENAESIVKGYDMVIAALDNLETRYLLNDTCYFLNKPLAEAGVMRFDGLGMTIIPKVSHCYRCVFPEAYQGPGSPIGILGPLPGVMGFIEAAETIKTLMGIGKTLKNNILLYNSLEAEFRLAKILKNPECPLCGNSPTINRPI